MGLEKPKGGEVIVGEHNVLPNYFEQNQVCDYSSRCCNFICGGKFEINDVIISQAEALDLDKTVLETVEEAAEDWRLDDIKGLLGRCNFKSDMLDRKVSLLSGGEKVKSHLLFFS